MPLRAGVELASRLITQLGLAGDPPTQPPATSSTAAGAGRVVVVGHSAGAPIALELAARCD